MRRSLVRRLVLPGERDVTFGRHARAAGRMVASIVSARVARARSSAAGKLAQGTGSAVTSRDGNERRVRMDWDKRRRKMKDNIFERTYRMSKAAFQCLLHTIGHALCIDESMATRSSGSAVPPELQLSMTLRFLAGGSYLDITDVHGVHASTMFACIWRVMDAINAAEPLRLHFPATDPDALAKLAATFSASRNATVLPGCVGALDGIALQIRRPVHCPNPRSFYNRKGFYAYAAQGMCDGHYRFTYWSCLCTGSTHDSLALMSSTLGTHLDRHRLPSPYWIAGDEAYACSASLLTPWPGRNVSVERDAFNFYLSSHRIHIEQAFGILVARWGILWRPLLVDYKKVPHLTMTLVRLHNFCINNRSTKVRARLIKDRQPGDNMSVPAQDECDTDPVLHRRRRDLERSGLRASLTERLRTNGHQRPASYPSRNSDSRARGASGTKPPA